MGKAMTLTSFEIRNPCLDNITNMARTSDMENSVVQVRRYSDGRGAIPDRYIIFSVHHSVQTGSGAYGAS
jgi:hypothetical protein